MSAKKSDGVGREKEGSIRSIVRAVMSMYDGDKTRLRVGSSHLEEFEVKVGVHQGWPTVAHCMFRGGAFQV